MTGAAIMADYKLVMVRCARVRVGVSGQQGGCWVFTALGGQTQYPEAHQDHVLQMKACHQVGALGVYQSLLVLLTHAPTCTMLSVLRSDWLTLAWPMAAATSSSAKDSLPSTTFSQRSTRASLCVGAVCIRTLTRRKENHASAPGPCPLPSYRGSRTGGVRHHASLSTVRADPPTLCRFLPRTLADHHLRCSPNLKLSPSLLQGASVDCSLYDV
jgi:hypothetical protein